jgi:hypothetical protein
LSDIKTQRRKGDFSSLLRVFASNLISSKVPSLPGFYSGFLSILY